MNNHKLSIGTKYKYNHAINSLKYKIKNKDENT